MLAAVFVAVGVNAAAADAAKKVDIGVDRLSQKLAYYEREVLQKLQDWYEVNRGFIISHRLTKEAFVQFVGFVTAEISLADTEWLFSTAVAEVNWGGPGFMVGYRFDGHALDFDAKSKAAVKEVRAEAEEYLIAKGASPAVLKSFSDMIWSLQRGEGGPYRYSIVPALEAFMRAIGSHSSL